MNSVDITPSPRVLRMLGQIDFAPWQCLAELIDNSVDAFIDQLAAGKGSASPRISVRLPNENELKAGGGAIVIKDNAQGMGVQDMQNAVRAGYSGNDPVEKMGLFGMGFNISTARMGRRTEVWTTRADDTEWTGIVIDFDILERQKTFQAPVLSRPKSAAELEDNTHGTEIKISRLEADRVRPLIRGAGKRKTRDRLGKIYGRVMANLGVSIIYDTDVIVPWKHCAWDPKRSVETQSFGIVPARIEIDKTLDARCFCTTCWVWLLEEEEHCSACGHADNVIKRKRRLRGWLGIQRYFDKDHYGIDLIRNGRVIEELDKSFFSFVDENGDSIFEYPIDATHWGGRIIGELEIDFVRVSHQKDSFDKLDPEWKRVVELIRGASPMQPKIAERMGLGKNSSPLAMLFTGYRKGTAGLKDLVPGTSEGTGLNSGLVRDYVERFDNSEADYQSDDKWYELVLQAERGKRGDSSGAEEAAGEFPIEENEVSDEKANSSDETGFEEAKKPDVDPFELDVDLSKTYEVVDLPGDIAIKVTAYRHKKDIDGAPFKVKPDGYVFRFDYNSRSPFFEESLESPSDFLVVDLAQHFVSLSAESVRTHPVSKIARYLRNTYFTSTSGDLPRASASAGSLLDELRRHYDENLPEIAPVNPNEIGSLQVDLIRRAALKAESASPQEVDAMIEQGKFGRFVSSGYVVELVRRWPALVTDGRFFDKPFEQLSSVLREESVGELVDSLQDVFWLADEGASAVSKDTGWRLRYGRALASLQLLQYWRV